MREQLQELWRYRELLIILVQRDLKVRYKNSILGFGWSLINPLVQVLTIALVFKVLGLIGGANQPKNVSAYLFCATLPWLFFSTAVMDSSLSLAHYHSLMKRVYFPRELLPLSAVIANLIHFLLATGVLLIYMALLPVVFLPLHGRWEWPIQITALLLPVPILGLSLFITGLAMFLSVWTLYFEDTRFLTDSALRILYWLVPIFYYPEAIRHHFNETAPGRGDLLYSLYMLNPLSTFISVFRKMTLPPAALLGSTNAAPPLIGLDWLFLGIACVTSLVIALTGHWFFNARQWRLAERA